MNVAAVRRTLGACAALAALSAPFACASQSSSASRAPRAARVAPADAPPRPLAAAPAGMPVGAPVAASAPVPRSAPISNIAYDVTIDSSTVARHDLAVSMRFDVHGNSPVVLALPAWSPGHYVLLWFARRVQNFTVTGDGKPLDWNKVDYQTWRILPNGAHTVRVSFLYRADTIDRAVAWTQPSFAFFLGTNVFLYPTGAGFDWPATVTVHTDPSWRVTTGMMPTPQPNTFTASNYHDLVDRPFFVGRFDLDSVQVADRWSSPPSSRWIRFATYPAGVIAGERRARMLDWIGKLPVPESAVFHEMPWRNYTVFLVTDTVVNGGGLEHQDAQMDEIALRGLDSPRNVYLFAHEMFHSWNVKRLRPADMVPYRYDDAEPTPWLWVSEGITDYYGDLAVVRAGLSDSTGFFDAMATDLAQVAFLPPTALSDASLSAWINPVDFTGGLYYPKGALTGFMLDIMIRDATNNAHSLDDVMRSLYQSVYKKTWRGFTDADWWGAVRAAAPGHDAEFADLERRYVNGRDAYPVDSVLARAGLVITADGNRRHVEVAPNASPRAARIRSGILHGTTFCPSCVEQR